MTARPAMRLLASSLDGRGREVRSLVAWSILEAAPAFASGRLIANAIDDGFLAGRTSVGLEWLALFGVCVLVGAWATRQTFQRLAALVEPFRDRLAVMAVKGALERSTAVGVQADTAGVARVTQQVEIAREAYASALMVVQSFAVTAVSALFGLLTLAPIALVLVLPPLAAGLALFVATIGHMEMRQRESIIADENLADVVDQMAIGLRDIVACGGEDYMAARAGAAIEAQARASRRLARLAALRTLTVALGGWLPVVLIVLAGPWLVDRGMSEGAVIGALAYVLQGVLPALQTLVRELGGAGLWLLVTLDRIQEVFEVPNTRNCVVATAKTGGGRGEVVVRGVTFSYGRSSVPVVRDLDLVVPEGDHLAIVGPSGVGKSTLTSLMSGVLSPQSGEVVLGGPRVLVPQQAYVFTGTVWENLTYLHPDATADEISSALHQLGAHELVERIGGLHAMVDPSQLSAGERQLLTAVRAYVAPAPIVLLDEATCHLDAETEAQIENAFATRGCTLIVVAHRMSSAARAKRILVMDGTRIAVGRHDALLESSLLYRDLVGAWAPEA